MSTGSTQPFQLAGAVSATATATPQNVPLAGVGDVVVITNLGTVETYVGVAMLASVGGTGCSVVPAGQRRAFNCNPLVGHVGVITPSGTANIFIEVGTGTVFG